jgi:signal transduction histidine kinase
MVLPMLGLFIFQAYWLSDTYSISEKRFKKDTQDALQEAIRIEMMSGAKNKLELLDSLGNGGEGAIHISSSLDEENPQNMDNIMRFLGTPDSIPTDAITITVEGNDSLSEALKSNFQSDLLSRDTTILVASKGNLSMGDSWMDLLMSVISEVSGGTIDLQMVEAYYDSILDSKAYDLNYHIQMSLDSLVMAEGRNIELSEGRESDLMLRQVGLLKGNYTFDVWFEDKQSLILWEMWLNILASFLLVVGVTAILIHMYMVILRQKKLSDLKNDFISNMTHELKTPIATVSAAVEALSSFGAMEDPKRAQTYLDISSKELLRLNEMVEKVLDVSAYEKERVSLQFESTDLGALYTEMISKLSLKNQDMKIKLEDKLQDNVELDRFHMSNLFNNLIDNAVKYSEGSAEIEVKLEKVSGSQVSIAVKDQGIGIPGDQIKHIFDKFYRVPEHGRRGIKGFGLGLSYVKHVVDGHGGTIDVKSECGVGTEFIILIPIRHG